MKTAFILLVAALAVASVAARCPNSCSGHGNCGRDDKCTCWANWQGNDCAMRTCGFDNSWGMNKYNPHFYAECSSKGICDRATGSCDCFDQYEGRACTRSSCPNGCSGHGKCRYINEQSGSSTYYGWDAEKIQVCVCDGGFYGPDCSQRYCPMGDDPLTICDDTANTDKDDYDIHRVTVSFNTRQADLDTKVAHQGHDDMVLKFTDPHGEVWTTQRIENSLNWSPNGNTSQTAGPLAAGSTPDFETYFWAAADRVRDALKALPNQVIPDVVVEPKNADGTAHEYSRVWDVSFTSPRNSGEQTALQCMVGGCMTAGCQPMYKQFRWENFGQFDEGFSTNLATTPATGVRLTADTIFAEITDTQHANSAGNFDYKVIVTVLDNSSFTEDDGRQADDNTAQGHMYRAAVAKYGDSSQDWTAAVAGAGSTDKFVEKDTADRRTAFATHYALNFADNAAYYDDTHRIPVEYSHVQISDGAFVAFGSREPTPGHYMWMIAVAKCTVDASPSSANGVHPNRENAECSNRGECDTATGLCACHEGYYGDNCQSQTILV